MEVGRYKKLPKKYYLEFYSRRSCCILLFLVFKKMFHRFHRFRRASITSFLPQCVVSAAIGVRCEATTTYVETVSFPPSLLFLEDRSLQIIRAADARVYMFFIITHHTVYTCFSIFAVPLMYVLRTGMYFGSGAGSNRTVGYRTVP